MTQVLREYKRKNCKNCHSAPLYGQCYQVGFNMISDITTCSTKTFQSVFPKREREKIIKTRRKPANFSPHFFLTLVTEKCKLLLLGSVPVYSCKHLTSSEKYRFIFLHPQFNVFAS